MLVHIAGYHVKWCACGIEPIVHCLVAASVLVFRQVAADDDRVGPHRPQPAQYPVETVEPITRPVRVDVAELGDNHGRTRATTDRGDKVAVPSETATLVVSS